MANNLITSGQLRAARLFLGWTQQDLANKCSISIMTIRRAEKETGHQLSNLAKARIIDILTKEGIEFIFPSKNIIGVTLKVKK